MTCLDAVLRACPPGLLYCAGSCVDASTDLANCGNCGVICSGICTAGVGSIPSGQGGTGGAPVGAGGPRSLAVRLAWAELWARVGTWDLVEPWARVGTWDLVEPWVQVVLWARAV